MSHRTDLSQAFSVQVPFDIAPNPNVVAGRVFLATRTKFGSGVIVRPVAHQQPIKQKRDETDMEQLRKMLGGLMQRPQAKMPNQEHADQWLKWAKMGK